MVVTYVDLFTPIFLIIFIMLFFILFFILSIVHRLTDPQEAYEAQGRDKALAFERQRDADRDAGLITGLYDVDVVGESHYQDALRRNAGPIGEWGAETSVIVALVREPNNRYDRNAVAVQLEASLVGYLPREEAELLGPMLKSLERGGPCKARATIRGGSTGAPLFGISIDGIPNPYEFADP